MKTEGMRLDGSPTILLAEDDVPIRTMIATILGMRNYNVLAAGHGGEAMAMSESFQGRIDLLVTDIMMPVMNGRDLAAKLSSSRPGLGVLFISGFPGDHLPESLGSDSPVDYLAKPFRPDSLLSKIGDLIVKCERIKPAG